MRLVSCYIENFGKLKKRAYHFEEGITAICEDNGAGKSTLAAFIKAIFYGMETRRSNAKGFADRLHYYPFEGGAFGGNLVFEMAGDTYKIERFFDEKSDTADTLTVYRNGEVYEGFGGDLGRAIFGIDKESFERTAFIFSGEIEIAATSSISSKLNGFLLGADEGGDSQKALAILEKESKEYKKVKSGKDLISDTTRRIDSLKAEIGNVEAIKRALLPKYEACTALEEQSSLLQAEILEGQTRNLVLNDWEHYEVLLAEIALGEKEKAALIDKYPAGMPTQDEINALERVLDEDEKLSSQSEILAFSPSDEISLALYAKQFVGGIPDEKEIAAYEEKSESVMQLDTALRHLNAVMPSEREKRLLQKYANGYPDEKELLALDEKARIYREAERAYRDTPACFTLTERVRDENKGTPKSLIIMAAVAAVLTAIGVALLFVMLAAGFALIALGIMLLVFDGFRYLNQKASVKENEVTRQKENPDKQKRLEDLTDASDALKAILLPYGYRSENGLLFDVDVMKNDIAEYRQYLAAQEDRLSNIASASEKKQALVQEIARFFARFGMTPSVYNKNFADLRSAIAAYRDLTERRIKASARQEALADRQRLLAEAVRAFCAKYQLASLTKPVLREMASDGIAYAALLEKNEVDRKRADAFRKEKKLTEKPQGAPTDIALLSETLDECRNRLSLLLREIEEDERQAERLDELLADKERAEEALASYKRTHKLLVSTIAFVKAAEDSLKEKYVRPVKEMFLKHAAVIEATLGEKITMDKNFTIRFERFGRERDEKHLSSGQRSIVAFCFRLALIANMYPEEKPFLIMDDPFLSLDATHLAKAKEVLSALLGDMQIVYFTCHESRML